MDRHDGNAVRVLLRQQDRNTAEFAKEMNIPRTTFQRMLDKKHWRAGELALASKILKVNLLAPYLMDGNLVSGILILPSPKGAAKAMLLSEVEERDMERWLSELGPGSVMGQLFKTNINTQK